MKKSGIIFLLALVLCIFVSAADPVYVDGTGNTPGAYDTLEKAVAALPDSGGQVIVRGAVTVGENKTWVTLPKKNGKVTVTGENGASLRIAYGLVLGSALDIDDIELVNLSTSEGFLTANGYTLTVGENVTTSRDGTDRWLTVWGADNTQNGTTYYDTHLIIRSGTWRYIFGGAKGTFNGDSLVEVSGVTVTKTLSAKNESGKGKFNGTGTLIVDLRGGKTVSAATFGETPVARTDKGFDAVCNGNVYMQIRTAAYVDGTGKMAEAFTSFAEAVSALPVTGGTVIISGDTEVGTEDFSGLCGVITVRCENNAVLTFTGEVLLGGKVTFDGTRIASAGGGIRVAEDAEVTVKENVTIICDSFPILLEKGGSAAVTIPAVAVGAAEGYFPVVNGNVYTVILRGDSNNDGRITIVDMLLVLKAILQDRFAGYMDMNGDDMLSLADAIQIIKSIVNASPDTPDIPESRLYAIGELNGNTEAWSHAEEDIQTASLERNRRESAVLSSETVGGLFFDSPHYPRIKKVREDLYLLTYMDGQYGGDTLLYMTSTDGVHWNAPEILWSRAEMKNNSIFRYTDGPLAGQTSSMTAVNPDACVLQNGDILAVYYLRPTTSDEKYDPYQQYCGVFIKRGTVDVYNRITWGEQQQLIRGRGWEPYVWQRPDGRIEVYWTNAATSLLKYGNAAWSCTCMVYSDDGGYTWTPEIEAWKDTDYLYIDVFQECDGTYTPTITDQNGNPLYTTPIPFFKGQMPSVTGLYNGKSLLAVEVRNMDDGVFHITLATSGENGNWTPLQYGEDAMKITDAVRVNSGAPGAAPYVSTFPSGEVFLVYNQGGAQRGRMISPDGKTEGAEFLPIPAAEGAYWGSCAVVDSHRVLSTIPSKSESILVNSLYLNHRINAKNMAVTVDGYTNDWKTNTDAFFVGSESQAQVTLRIAHDADNVYFLFSLLDDYLTERDSVTVGIGGTSLLYKYGITVQANGIATLDTYLRNTKVNSSALSNVRAVLHGTVGKNTDKDAGAVIELAVPKSELGLVGKTAFSAFLALINNDGGESISDTFDGVSITETDRWPKVVLD